jgi:lysyl-tRNA synthetase class 2
MGGCLNRLPTGWDTGVAPLVNLALRSRALAAMRAFFTHRDFVEVETPVRIPAPALELHIDAPPAGSGHWLRTSPELHMKRMLAAGCPRLFQIGPCFRAGERGARHTPEFTLLEWYRAHAGCGEILADTEALVRYVAQETLHRATLTVAGAAVDLAAPWHVLTVREAFRGWAGWDPVADYDADRFDLDLVNRVEPALPRDRPVVLTDYPAAAAALARLKPGDSAVAERWELYIGGLEIANAYGELTDPHAQRARFLACAEARRAHGREVYPLDESFLGALEEGLPPSGGIALGVDRLVMLLCGAVAIEEVRSFCPVR